MRRGEQATKSEPLPRHRHPTCRKWCNRAQRGSMDELIQNLSYSVRQMARKPGFAAVLMVTLVLGVGANTAVFSVVHNVLLPWRGSDGTSNSTKWVCVVDHCGCGRWCASGRSGHRTARSPVPGACAESCHVVSRAEYDTGVEPLGLVSSVRRVVACGGSQPAGLRGYDDGAPRGELDRHRARLDVPAARFCQCSAHTSGHRHIRGALVLGCATHTGDWDPYGVGRRAIDDPEVGRRSGHGARFRVDRLGRHWCAAHCIGPSESFVRHQPA